MIKNIILIIVIGTYLDIKHVVFIKRKPECLKKYNY